MIWTTTHVPSLTLPVFKGPAGLPVGAQLIARRGDDRKLFAAARWVYRQLAWNAPQKSGGTADGLFSIPP